jgi:hypothetical protein
MLRVGFVAALLLLQVLPAAAAPSCRPTTYDALACKTTYSIDACRNALRSTQSAVCRTELEARLRLLTAYTPIYFVHNPIRWATLLTMMLLSPIIAVTAVLIARQQGGFPRATLREWLLGPAQLQSASNPFPVPIGKVPVAAASLLFIAAMTCLALGLLLVVAIILATILMFIAILKLMNVLAPEVTTPPSSSTLH